MTKVVATDVGYDNVEFRQPGDVFDAPRGPKGKDGSPGKEILKAKWYKPVEAVEEPEESSEEERPVA